jgi:hypothetical protein
MAQKGQEIWNSCPQDAFQISGENTKTKVDKTKQMKPADRKPATGLSKERWFKDATSFGEWSEGIASFIQRKIRFYRSQTMYPQVQVQETKKPYDPGIEDPKFTGGIHPDYRR